MTAEDFIYEQNFETHSDEDGAGIAWEDVLKIMDKYAKYHAELAFEAGIELMNDGRNITVFNPNKITKEDYITKTFKDAI